MIGRQSPEKALESAIRRFLLSRYNLKAKLSRDTRIDSYKVDYVVECESFNPKHRYRLVISQDDIGPARQKDFIEAIKEQIEEKYPELML